jgi:putative ABC transport system substrate-binding protein
LRSYRNSAHVQFCIRLLLLLSLLPAFAYAGELKIALVLSEQGGAYQEYANELAAQLSANGVTLTVTDAGKPLPEADLVVAAGMKASLHVAASTPAAMLVVLVPKEGVGKLTSEFPALVKPGKNRFSSIYLDQPFNRQLDLVAAVLPKARSVGVLYSAQPRELARLRTAAAERNYELNERISTSFPTMNAALQSLLLSSDVLLALPDAEIFNASTIRNILLTTYRSKVPLVGFSPGYVKAGALCAVYSTPQQIAEQSADMIRAFANVRVLPAAQYAKQFEVSVNEQVARSLGLNIRSAAEVGSEIGAVQ